MSYSIGLTLYTLATRRDPVVRAPWPERPRGRLVWLHAPRADGLGAVLALARRLVEEDGLPVLLTTPEPLPDVPWWGLVVVPPPCDTLPEAQAFLAHWKPEAAVFCGGEMRPALLYQVAAAHVPALLVEARTPYLLQNHTGWYPGLVRSCLGGFDHVLTLDEASARTLRKSGARPDRVEPVGRLEQQSAALPYVESDRAALARALATRPIWLAACVPEAEEDAVIAAHREALRLSHRLLLILVPQDPARAPLLADRMERDEDWSVTLRSAAADPDAETEVYIPDSDTDREFGLWYRLAPVTYLGGSLLGTGCSRDPMEPAALGSAILHGPRPGRHGPVLGRLGAARAARIVGSPEDLAQALGDLLSPDRAARQAEAAWDVVSEGAEVTMRVVTLIRTILEGEP